jgi:hypothetical protein
LEKKRRKDEEVTIIGIDGSIRAEWQGRKDESARGGQISIDIEVYSPFLQATRSDQH